VAHISYKIIRLSQFCVISTRVKSPVMVSLAQVCSLLLSDLVYHIWEYLPFWLWGQRGSVVRLEGRQERCQRSAKSVSMAISGMPVVCTNGDTLARGSAVCQTIANTMGGVVGIDTMHWHVDGDCT